MKRLGSRLLRLRAANEAVRRLASLRGLSLVLVYHRVEPDDGDLSGVIPRVTRSTFVRHLEALGEAGDVVDLHEVLERRAGRVRFAITFDDDYGSHVVSALPILREAGVGATFFLSGRTLHGLGPYWFEGLDGLVRSRGLREAARTLGVEADTADDLATACELNGDVRRGLEARLDEAGDPLSPGAIRILAEAGMTIGFHTLEHPALPALGDGELETALSRGRQELARVAGHSPTLFAYPYGKADERSARAVRDAGYSAAWTGRPTPVHPAADRFLLGRWEPGSLDVEDFVAKVAVRFLRASGTGS